LTDPTVSLRESRANENREVIESFLGSLDSGVRRIAEYLAYQDGARKHA